MTETLEPGSPEWLRLMTASKVAAVLGLSSYESPRSLWHLMRGDVQADDQTVRQARGHYLEPSVLAWFFDQHPEFCRAAPRGTVIHESGWMAATPDAEALIDMPNSVKSVPVEAKTDAGDYEWGDKGTDEIPLHYAAQCMWTMHVLGAERIYVPMLTERLEFREYVVEYDAELAADIEAKCRAFYESLSGDVPPVVDSHPATFDTLKRINPLIDVGGEIQLQPEHAALFVKSRADQAAADAQTLLANSTIAEVMGNAQKAYYGTALVARRQNTASGKPALYAARSLPTIELKADAA